MPKWFPENISTVGTDIDSLFYMIFYITGIAFVITQGIIIFSLIRYHRRKGRIATYIRGNKLSESAWILVPFLVVVLIDVWIDFRSSAVWEKIHEPAQESPYRVQVTAKQFNWEVLYPGPDQKFNTEDDVQIENELHVPVNEVIRVGLKSKDVIHSFCLPNLRLKQDVLPGREVEIWFKTTKPGQYEIPCAELCGFGHSGMLGHLIVHTADEYSEWVKQRWGVRE